MPCSLAARAMTDEIHMLQKSTLRDVDPLENMKNLSITMVSSCLERYSNTPCSNTLLTDEGFPLSLGIIKYFEESNPVKNKETLKTINIAVSQGMPVESQYYPSNDPEGKNGDCFYIFHNQKSTSIFRLIGTWCAPDSSIDEAKKDTLMNTIFQGGYEQQERLDGIRNKWIADIGSVLGIDVSEDLILLILSYDENYKDGEERIACIKQAEQEFLKERKSQPVLFHKSSSEEQCASAHTSSLRKLLQKCMVWSKIR